MTKLEIVLERTDKNFKVTNKTITVGLARLTLSQGRKAEIGCEVGGPETLHWTIDGDPGTPYQISLAVDDKHELDISWKNPYKTYIPTTSEHDEERLEFTIHPKKVRAL